MTFNEATLEAILNEQPQRGCFRKCCNHADKPMRCVAQAAEKIAVR